MTTLTLEVYEGDGTTLVDTIDPGQFLAAEFMDIGSQPGTGRLVLKSRIAAGAVNPAIALIEEDRIVRYLIDDDPVWQLLLGTDSQEVISPRSQAGEVMTITGPGVMAIFDKVLWYPDAGLDNLPFHPTRFLNFSADRLRDDDAAGPQGIWPGAVAQLPNYDTDNYFGRPSGFIDTAGPDGDGPEWLSDRDTREDYAPAGIVYGRQRFTLDDEYDMLVQAAFDDEGELWIDNVPVCRVEGVYKGQSCEARVTLTAGEHLASWWCRNLNELRMGAVYAGWSVTQGMADLCKFRSDASQCIVLGFPAKPPGFTPTEVIRLGVDEANDRGMLPDVDALCTFISASDSEHQPLQEVTDIAVKAPADTLLTTLLMLGETYLDLWMSPSGIELNAMVRGTRGNAA